MSFVCSDSQAGFGAFWTAVAGYRVIEAENGAQASRYAADSHVELIITDLAIPEQEGLETIDLVRRRLPGVKIIAISGAFHGEYLRIAKLLGAHAVLAKPVGRDQLLKVVNTVLSL